MDAPSSGVARDSYLGGKIALFQPKDGYRAGVDAALLAAGLALKPGQTAVEFGCGVGAALFSAAALYPQVSLLGLDRDAQSLSLARRNAELNGVADRVALAQADVLQFRPSEPVDAVFFNPPFFDDENALRAPKDSRRGAWINEAGIGAWIARGLQILKPKGFLTLIHRADALPAILAAVGVEKASVEAVGVHPKAENPAKRVVVRVRKAGRAPFKLLAPLVLHAGDGPRYAPLAEAVLRGRAKLAFTV